MVTTTLFCLFLLLNENEKVSNLKKFTLLNNELNYLATLSTWSKWGLWSACSVTCGGCGKQRRVRACYGKNQHCP
uniref:Uncharacterized protein n=1 Tax=Elaeophora elaphi TaxID=1147741 RepID=A0A0R3S0V2_9BILA